MIKAMVVDDERLVRKGFTSLTDWEAFGIEIVAEASDGMKALKMMEEQPIDLLFTDITMPVMNGFELMEQVRLKYPGMWTVVLTCHHEFDYIQEAMRHGAIDYIVKTLLEDDNVNQTINRIVERIQRDKSLRTVQSAAAVDQALSTLHQAQVHDDELENKRELWLELKWGLDWLEWEHFTKDMERIQPGQPWLKDFAKCLFQECGLNMVLREDAPRLLENAGRLRQWPEWKIWFRDLVILLIRTNEQQGMTKEITLSLIKAIRYSRNHLDLNLTQEEIARYVSMSRGYFSKTFKKFTGEAYIDFLREARIEQARAYLEESEISIVEIAEKVGFEDERYFSKQFRERTGLTPSQYRASFKSHKLSY